MAIGHWEELQYFFIGHIGHIGQTPASMPIDLGLSRVLSLLKQLGNPQHTANYIHIAGTNGKGSVCSYLSSILHANTRNYKIGKFTSPHLIYRHDCISLDNKPVSRETFQRVEQEILELNKKYSIGCTEFEILTVVAFQIFNLEKVDLAVLEVGLGGRLDSTNVVDGAVIKDGKVEKKGVLCTGITKIGLDHESILGSTLGEIAYQKAGILKHGIPNVTDGTNEPEVLKVVNKVAGEESSENYSAIASSQDIQTSVGTINRDLSPLKGHYQVQNLLTALTIIDLVLPLLKASYPESVNYTYDNLIKGVQNTRWPGRLQSLQLKFSKDKPALPVLLDGAHNAQAAIELRKYLKATYGDNPITFIMAVTKGKDLSQLLASLVRPTDRIIITQFGAVDGMPWIQANDPVEFQERALKYATNVTIEKDLTKAFESVTGDVVVCGSLYLVGEVLKLHEDNS